MLKYKANNKMSTKVAIDIALFLPEKIGAFVCDLSASLIRTNNMKPYIIDNKVYFSHVSLLMGTIERDNIFSVKEKIEPIVKKYLPLEVHITGIDTSLKFPILTVEKTGGLFALHYEVMKSVNLGQDAVREMFVEPEVTDGSIEYVRNFRNARVGDNFYPHITLGNGNTEHLKIEFPIRVSVNEIAICQLGYSCSCRKVLEKITV